MEDSEFSAMSIQRRKKKVFSTTDAGTIEFHMQKTSAGCLLRPYTKKINLKEITDSNRAKTVKLPEENKAVNP